MRSPDRLDRNAIAALIPHQGAMCLLDAIDGWSRELAREDGTVARLGYLVAVRDVRIGVRQLDRIEADLEIRATRLAADAGSLLYAFVITAEQKMILNGRAVVTLERAGEGGR
jgi:predicted hotdog family 3-hydroxylacyl-ACP dehydratase